jgi:site-specific DNA-methyltransferase (adenine-specific)
MMPALTVQKPTILTRDPNSNASTLILGEALGILQQMPANTFAGAFTDPPFSSGGLHLSSRSQATSTKYQGAAFKNLYPEFEGDNRDQVSQLLWLQMWLTQTYRVTQPGGPIGVFTDWRQMGITINALQMAGYTYRGIVVWDKTKASRPQLGKFRAQCEYVIWGSKGPMATKGRPTFPGCFTVSAQKGGKFHIAGKPVELMQQLIEIVPPGGAILDPFAGSGSTGVACMGRNPFTGIELTQANFNTAAQRLGLMTPSPKVTP